MPADESFTVSSIPAPMTWKNQPSERTSAAEQQISITAGAESDWFIHPAGGHVKSNAPIALFAPPDHAFCLQARVTVEFAATYDAGTLFVYVHDALWAKLCFEYSPQQQPMIVSVVTVASPTTAIQYVLRIIRFTCVSIDRVRFWLFTIRWMVTIGISCVTSLWGIWGRCG